MRCLTVTLLALSATFARADGMVAGLTSYHAERGVHRVAVKSATQKGETVIEVLLPAKYDPEKAYRVVYVLPVEVGIGGRFGDGLMEVKRLGLHDRFDVICATMSFDTIPWYADHATDPKVRQGAYVREVVKLVESRWRTPGDRSGRLLLGFSKSGWGAVSLLLREPEFYGYAASWDAPLMLDERDWQAFEIPKALGTKGRFNEVRPNALVGKAAEVVKTSKRIVITGEASFGTAPGGRYGPEGHTVGFSKLLERAGVPHVLDAKVKAPHTWGGGWAGRTFELLVGLAGK